MEPGEIEFALVQHPSISQAAVIAYEKTPDDCHLAAYLVADREPSPTADTLRRFLQTRLPDAMIPSSYTFIDTMPLTQSGKLDRQALPAPDPLRPEPKNGFVHPRTQTEQILAGIWSEVLKIEPVGIYERFFDLGGHSLLAIQVMSRVQQALQMDIPLRSLFEIPTVADLAEYIDTVRWASQEPQALHRENGTDYEEGVL